MSRDDSTLLTLDTRPDEDGGGVAGARMPALTIVGHPDPARLGERAFLVDLGKPGGRLELSRNAPAFAPPSLRGAEPLAEVHVSRKPALLTRGEGGITVDVRGTSTRVDVAGAVVDGTHEIRLPALDEGVLVTLAGRVSLWLDLSPAPRPSTADRLGMIGVSAGIERVRGEIERVADTDISVLVRGETGSGKELVARAVHDRSPRRSAPFVAINMASVPHTLAASQLFGHARGAFSGADRSHRGLFEQADGGTLFLDEIGDTPPEVQVMLLRTLETGEVVPVGGERAQRVDVRVIAATDRDLDAATADGGFRSPLYHRLAGFVIAVPPLRRRRVDVSVLLHAFLREELAALGEPDRLAAPGGPWLSPRLLERLMAYPWPGNVRELRNAARQIAVASRGLERAELGEHLERTLSVPEQTRERPSVAADAGVRRPADVDEDELVAALRDHRWRIAPTAQALGIPRPSLYDLIAKSDRVRKASDLSAAEIEAARDAVGSRLRDLSERLEVSERGLLFRMRELGLA